MGWGAEGMKYRFQWTFPIVLSPHDPNTLYAGGNVLFKSTDEGHSWTAISPDLTRNDPKKLGPSGGPITKDNTSVEYYCTIFAMAESKAQPGVLWAGSDDGLVHVSRDGGAHWDRVTPRDLPEWSMISQIDPSPHDAGTAFLAANRYKQDDYRPYAYVTTDFGKTWRKIVNGLPANSFVRVVRQDLVRKNLLFCGTETGAYFSPDGGARWWPLRMNLPGATGAETAALTKAHAAAIPEDAGKTLADEPEGLLPVVPVTDLVVKGNDLVISTQGRSFWILDDISPLRQFAAAAPVSEAHLYRPPVTALYGGFGGGGTSGQNPPRGVLFYYWLRDEPGPKDEISLELIDAAGDVVRKLTNKDDESAGAGAGGGGGDDGGPGGGNPKLPARAGLNRFAWNFRYPDAKRFPGLILWGGSTNGPEAVPGSYQAKLTVNGETKTVPFELRNDPRLDITQAGYQERFELLMKINKKVSETHEAVLRIRDVRDQVKGVAERAKSATKDTTIAAAAKALTGKLTKVEEALYQTKNQSSQDPLNFPIRLNDKLSALTGVVESASAPPTSQAYVVYDDLNAKIDAELERLRTLLATDLAQFNQLVRDQNVPAVVVREKTAADPRAPAPGGKEPDEEEEEE